MSPKAPPVSPTLFSRSCGIAIIICASLRCGCSIKHFAGVFASLAPHVVIVVISGIWAIISVGFLEVMVRVFFKYWLKLTVPSQWCQPVTILPRRASLSIAYSGFVPALVAWPFSTSPQVVPTRLVTMAHITIPLPTFTTWNKLSSYEWNTVRSYRLITLYTVIVVILVVWTIIDSILVIMVRVVNSFYARIFIELE